MQSITLIACVIDKYMLSFKYSFEWDNNMIYGNVKSHFTRMIIVNLDRNYKNI